MKSPHRIMEKTSSGFRKQRSQHTQFSSCYLKRNIIATKIQRKGATLAQLEVVWIYKYENKNFFFFFK